MLRCMLGEWRGEVHAGRVACRGACWGSGMSRCMLGVACGGACWDSGM